MGETDEPRNGCIFCDLPAEGPDGHLDNLILSCGELAFVILNRYPYNNGHLMVVPRRHVSDPAHLDGREYRVLTGLVRRASSAMWPVLQADGINIGMNLGRTAGAGIDEHCHYHLVPRWNGDTNFVYVVGGSKVISVSLEDSYEQLLPAIGPLAAQVEEDVA